MDSESSRRRAFLSNTAVPPKGGGTYSELLTTIKAPSGIEYRCLPCPDCGAAPKEWDDVNEIIVYDCSRSVDPVARQEISCKNNILRTLRDGSAIKV